MLTPPPVSGEEYPTSVGSSERSNYLRGGMAFTSAYTDNAVGSVAGRPLSDVSYSVAPFISLDETTSRLHWILNYAPGFTFYQRLSSRNETDQNASIDLQYRLSPHVTFSARDGFQKSSNVFNQPDLGGVAVVAGGTQQPNFSVIAPIADRLSDFGNVGINYQFAANGMVGASGTFSYLHYPNQAQVPGLFRFQYAGRNCFLYLAGFEDALHRRHVSVPEIGGVSDVGSERHADSRACFSSTRFTCRRICRCPFSEDRNIRIQCNRRNHPCCFRSLPHERGLQRREAA